MIYQTNDKKKILLIRHRDYSYTDIAIYKQLVKWFPQCDVSTFNVYEIHKKITIIQLFINLFYFIWEYGIDFISGAKEISNISTFFKSTSYFASIYRKHTTAAIKSDSYFFIFQLQSLFNGAVEGVPHFVYSDHITMANYFYPDINPRQYVRSSSFIKTEKKLYLSALRCFTMSSNIAKMLVKEYCVPESKVKCVYSGSNVELDNKTNQNTYDNKTILFVGLEWDRKGGPILVKTFEKVLIEVPDAQLIIIGCNPKIHEESNISVLGKLKLDELPQYFNHASVFCMPTLREPFGLVFVEAMTYGLPIVANNIGALPDMVTNGVNGYLINNNIDEYAKVLIELLNNPQKCKNMGENGAKIANELYTWDEVGKKLYKYITEALV